MAGSPDQPLLEALLDSWDRNNTILLNLLRALPHLSEIGHKAGQFVVEFRTPPGDLLHIVFLLFLPPERGNRSQHEKQSARANQQDVSLPGLLP